MSAAIDLLRDLVRSPSVTPDAAGALDVLESFLAPLGFICTRLPFGGDGSYTVDNLFATRGNTGPHLLFSGHVDVVPAGDAGEWTHDPFSAHQDAQGVIWGRGAVDMKSGVAAFCASLPAFIASGSADSCTISLSITGDEEADAVNGTVKVLQWAAQQNHSFDFGLVGEPTSTDILGDMVKIGRRGSLDFTITVSGAQGHVAYPSAANNPLPVLSAIAAQCACATLDRGNENFQPSNLELTSIDTGNSASNVIPSSATIRGNIRFNNIWDAKKLEQWLSSQILAIPADGCDVQLAIRKPVSRSFISRGSGYVDMLVDSVRLTTGIEPSRSTGGGTSDARFIADYCPVAEFGLVGKTMHQRDERVDATMVLELQSIYSHFLHSFAAQE